MRHRSRIEREREALARKHKRKDSEEFERVLKADAIIENHLEAMRLTYGDEHGTHVTYDAHTGWYGVERNGHKEHMHAADLTRKTNLLYAKLHEQELGGDAD